MGRARGLLWALAALLGCVGLLTLAPIAVAATGSISGTVTEAAAPKRAISGIDVDVYEAGNEFFAVGSAVTSVTGAYTVGDLGPGSYRVKFTPAFESMLNFLPQYWNDESSFADATPVVIAGEGEAKTGIDAELLEGGTIAGKVTNADAQPVEGAEVDVFTGVHELEGFAGEVRTDANGEYSVVGLATETYRVEITPPFGANLVPQFYANEPSFAEATPVAVEVKKRTEVNVTLQVGGQISGRVTNAVTHNPVAGVFVFASNAAGFGLFTGFAVTNGKGEYTIPGLANGSYNLEFSSEIEGSTEYISQSDNGVSVTQGSTTSGVNVALVPQAPNNTSSPVASGTPAVGQTLSCSNGSWSGVSTISYAYKWLRDGSAIEGATGSSYVVQSADQGHGVACEVTATNSKGHSSVTSNTLSVPAPPPPPPPPVPAIALPTTKVIVTGDSARVPITCSTAAPCSGTIELVRQTVVKHRNGHRTVIRIVTTVLGEATFALAAGHSGLFVVHLNRVGKHKLDATKHHRLPILLVVSVHGGKTVKTTALLMQAAVKRK
jgi:hypothetical protein